MREPISLELSGDAAIVLFEFLARFDDDWSRLIDDQAEERVLWNLHGQIEKKLVEPFDPNYKVLLAAARGRLRDPIE